jgi:hypothetical protein
MESKRAMQEKRTMQVLNRMHTGIAIAHMEAAEALLDTHGGMVVPTVEAINHWVGRGIDHATASILKYHARAAAHEALAGWDR